MTENYEYSKFLANERYGSQLKAGDRHRRLHEGDEVGHKKTAKTQLSSLAIKANAMFHQMISHSSDPVDRNSGNRHRSH